MRQISHRFAVSLFAVAAALATGIRPAAAEDGPAEGDAKPKVVQIETVTLDLGKREARFKSEVVLRSGPLELLACKAGTKEHESILATDAEPSHLHAALLALGLTPGRAARWIEDADFVRAIPPRGPHLRISLRWQDAQGKAHEADAASWLTVSGEDGTEPPQHWIFIGSRMMPDGEYLADSSGDIITVANFMEAVIDVPFESSRSNEQLEFEANQKVIPPVGTPVTVVVSPMPGAEKSPYALKMVEIDRFGRIRAGGAVVDAEELRIWASKYIAAHPRGAILLRADGRALVADVQRAIGEMQIGGVRDFEVERLMPAIEIPPRTTEQARDALQKWAQDFENAHDLIISPFETAPQVLDQLEAERELLEARARLLAEYREKLSRLHARYKAATQPAAP
jgi:hypothetical protein